MNQEKTSPSGILACSDFFFVTRVCDTARELGQIVRSSSDFEQIAEFLSTQNISILLIDLSSMSDCLAELPRFRLLAPNLTVVAFGSHVDTTILKKAREAGCDQVMPRSKFTTELVNLLEQYLPTL